VRADLHIHTMYSPDSRTTLEQIIERCTETGIDCVAITDHNTIAGSVEMKRIAPFRVIVSSEIHTGEGEVIGYFLKEEIPKRLQPKETVRRIKEQGGLVCVPHPFDRMRGSSITRSALYEILPYVDIMEVFNARSIFRHQNSVAERFAREHNLTPSAGSDAHTHHEIGGTYVEMPDFTSVEGFLAALKEGRIVGRHSSFWVHAKSTWSKVRKV